MTDDTSKVDPEGRVLAAAQEHAREALGGYLTWARAYMVERGVDPETADELLGEALATRTASGGSSVGSSNGEVKGCDMGCKYGRNTDGTFAPGNPGKPRGTRHRATRAVLELLEGEAEALTRTAVGRALEGDPAALRLCLERIAPPRKDSPVTFTLPAMRSARDAAQAAGAVLAAVAEGELTPTEGAHAMALVESYRRTLETTEIEARVAELEEAILGAAQNAT